MVGWTAFLKTSPPYWESALRVLIRAILIYINLLFRRDKEKIDKARHQILIKPSKEEGEE
jgi:hypothetical protein